MQGNQARVMRKRAEGRSEEAEAMMVGKKPEAFVGTSGITNLGVC